MPVCQGCGASYKDTIDLCPYCGRSKPTPETLHINITAPKVDNDCPLGHGVPHRVELVQGIVRRGGNLSEELSLSLPKFVNTSYGCTWIFIVFPGLYVPAFMAAPIVGILYLIIFAITRDAGWILSEWGQAIFIPICVIAGLSMEIWWFKRFKKKDKIRKANDEQVNNDLREKQKILEERWTKFYYCYQDDIVFDPQTQKYCKPSDIDKFTNSLIQAELKTVPPPMPQQGN